MVFYKLAIVDMPYRLGHMQNKITDTFIMKSNNKQIVTNNDFKTELTRLERKSNGTKRWTTEKEKIKSPRFAFLKISASAHCTHPENLTMPNANTNVFGKSAILPTLKKTNI